MTQSIHQGYSADVTMNLRVNGVSYSIARLGPAGFAPSEPLTLPECDAEIVMTVDGDTFVWEVRLPHGAVPFDRYIRTISLGDMQQRGRTVAISD